MAQPASLRNKFASVNLNSSYGKPAASQQHQHQQQQRPTLRVGLGLYGGMVVLGRGRGKGNAGVSGTGGAMGGAMGGAAGLLDKCGKLAVPGPVNLPSLRREHLGNDPTVVLVERSGAGWARPSVGKVEGVLLPPQCVMAAPAGGDDRGFVGVGNSGETAMGSTWVGAVPRPTDPGDGGMIPLAVSLNGDNVVSGQVPRSRQVYDPPAVREASMTHRSTVERRDGISCQSGLSPVIPTRVLFQEDFPTLAAATQPPMNPQRKLKEQQARQREQQQRLKVQQVKLQQLSEQRVQHRQLDRHVPDEQQLEQPLIMDRSHLAEEGQQKGEMCALRLSSMAKSPVHVECEGCSCGQERAVAEVAFHHNDFRRPPLLTEQSRQFSSRHSVSHHHEGVRAILGTSAEGLQHVEKHDHRHQPQPHGKREEERQRVIVGGEGGRSMVSPWIPPSRNWTDDERDLVAMRGTLNGVREDDERGAGFLRAGIIAREKGARDGYCGGPCTISRRGGTGVESEQRGGFAGNLQGGDGALGYTLRCGVNVGSWVERPESPLLEFGRAGHLSGIRTALSDAFRTDGAGLESVRSGRLGRREEKKEEFRDPVREAFDAELEMVQQMQEQERQKRQQEKEMAAERARIEQKEQERREKEEEEKRLATVREAQKAREAAEREATAKRVRELEVGKKSEDEKRQRELERQQYDERERTRKENAAKKLRELEERIARREAEKRREEEEEQQRQVARKREEEKDQEDRHSRKKDEEKMRQDEERTTQEEERERREKELGRGEEEGQRREEGRRGEEKNWRELVRREEERWDQETKSDQERVLDDDRMLKEEKMRDEKIREERIRDEKIREERMRAEELLHDGRTEVERPKAEERMQEERKAQRPEEEERSREEECWRKQKTTEYGSGGNSKGCGLSTALSRQGDDLQLLGRSGGCPFGPLPGVVHRPPGGGEWSELGFRGSYRCGGSGGSCILGLDRLRASSAPCWRNNCSVVDNGARNSDMSSPPRSSGEPPIYSNIGRDAGCDFQLHWNRDKERDRERAFSGRGGGLFGDHEGREYGWTHGGGLRLGSPRVRGGGEVDHAFSRKHRMSYLPLRDWRLGSGGDNGSCFGRQRPGLSSSPYRALDMREMGGGSSSCCDFMMNNSRDLDRRCFRDRGRERVLMMDNRGEGGARRTREESLLSPPPPYVHDHHCNGAARSMDGLLNSGHGFTVEPNGPPSSSCREDLVDHEGNEQAQKEAASYAREQGRILEERGWRTAGYSPVSRMREEVSEDADWKNGEAGRKSGTEQEEVDRNAVDGVACCCREGSSLDNSERDEVGRSGTGKLVEEEATAREPNGSSTDRYYERTFNGAVDNLHDKEEAEEWGEDEDEPDDREEQEEQREEEKRDQLWGNVCISCADDEVVAEVDQVTAGCVCRVDGGGDDGNDDEDGDDDNRDVRAAEVGDVESDVVRVDLVDEAERQLHADGSKYRNDTETVEGRCFQREESEEREDSVEEVDDVHECEAVGDSGESEETCEEALGFIRSSSSSSCMQQPQQRILTFCLETSVGGSRPSTPAMSVASDQQPSRIPTETCQQGGMMHQNCHEVAFAQRMVCEEAQGAWASQRPSVGAGVMETPPCSPVPQPKETIMQNEKLQRQQYQGLVGHGSSLQGMVVSSLALQEHQRQEQVGFQSYGGQEQRKQQQQGSFVSTIPPMMRGKFFHAAAPIALVASSRPPPQALLQQQHFPPSPAQYLTSSLTQPQLQQQYFQRPATQQQKAVVAMGSAVSGEMSAGQGQQGAVKSAASRQQQHQQHQQQQLHDLLLEQQLKNMEQQQQLNQQFVPFPQSPYPGISRGQEQQQPKLQGGAVGGDAGGAGGSLLPGASLGLGFQTPLPASIHIGSIPLSLTAPHAPHLMSSFGCLPHALLFPSLGTHHQQAPPPLLAPSLSLTGQVVPQMAEQQQQRQSQQLIQQVTGSSMMVPADPLHHDHQQHDGAPSQVLQQQQQEVAMVSHQREVQVVGMLGDEQSVVLVQSQQQGPKQQRAQRPQPQQHQQKVEKQQSLSISVLQQQQQKFQQQMLAPQQLQQGSLQQSPAVPLQQQLLHEQLQHQMQQLHQLQQLHQQQQLHLQHLQRFQQASALQAPTALWSNVPLLSSIPCLLPDPNTAGTQSDPQAEALRTGVFAVQQQQEQQNQPQQEQENQQQQELQEQKEHQEQQKHHQHHQHQQPKLQPQEQLDRNGGEEQQQQQQQQWEAGVQEMKMVSPGVLIAPSVVSRGMSNKGTATTTTSMVSAAEAGVVVADWQAVKEKQGLVNALSLGQKSPAIHSELPQEDGCDLLGMGTKSNSTTMAPYSSTSALKQSEGEKAMNGSVNVGTISADLTAGGQGDGLQEQQQQRLSSALGRGTGGAGASRGRGIRCTGMPGRGKAKGGTGGGLCYASGSPVTDNSLSKSCPRHQRIHDGTVVGWGSHQVGGGRREIMASGMGITSEMSSDGVVLRTRPNHRGIRRSGELRCRDQRWVAPERGRGGSIGDKRDAGGTSDGQTGGAMGDSTRGTAAIGVLGHMMASVDSEGREIVHDSRRDDCREMVLFFQEGVGVGTASVAQTDIAGSSDGLRKPAVGKAIPVGCKTFGSNSMAGVDSERGWRQSMLVVPATGVKTQITGKSNENGGVVGGLAACTDEVAGGGVHLPLEATEAPLHTGVVRVFEQPGIETLGDNDDFIEVRSKRQIYNDKREQREKENKTKSKDNKSKEPEKGGGGGGAAGRVQAKVVQKVTLTDEQVLGSGSQGQKMSKSLGGVATEKQWLHSRSLSSGTGESWLGRNDPADAGSFPSNSTVHLLSPVVQQCQQQQQQPLEQGSKMKTTEGLYATSPILASALHAMSKSIPVTDAIEGKSMRYVQRLSMPEGSMIPVFLPTNVRTQS